ncbi:molybdopterin-synthase adenylyltransferase MoeB [Haliea sp. E17]|uniref:molybdopterin-synthase adenylyltransferase MoeB n=1 Tax=Haliea sp. E17 TaxID=3401576 RepID=UPI003AAC2DCA
MPELNKAEYLRYSRHLVMPEIGPAGQQRLKAARVLCVGAGGLGSPAALYLAAAGIGHLGIAEFDTLDLSNLQRQVLYASDEVGQPKLDAACARLAALNPEITIQPHPMRLEADNVMALIEGYDVIIDGSDNFATRYLLNAACIAAGKPDVHASVLRFEGQLTVFDARQGPCLRCLFPEPPPAELVPSCSEGGVLGVIPGILGSLQALEAIKLVLGIGEPLIGRLLLVDGLGMHFRELELRRDPQCPGCGPHRESSGSYEVFSASWAAHNGGSAQPAASTISPAALAVRLAGGDPPRVLDVRQAQEYAIAHIEGSLLLPLDELEQGLRQLDPTAHYVLTCHHGGRSERAWQQLRMAGFERISVLEGGIDAWALTVDRELPRY